MPKSKYQIVDALRAVVYGVRYANLKLIEDRCILHLVL
jgi:hypothetical protein